MQRRLLMIGVSLSSFMMLAQPALAQTTPDTTAGPNADQNQNEEIIVTARRQSESLQQTPVAVTAFTDKDLKQGNIQDITQIKNITPNFFVAPLTNDRFNVLLGIRGIYINNTVQTIDPAIGVYVDSVYQGPSTGVMLSKLLDVSRVEVLRGPQGTLFGRNNTGGAITIYTNMPTDQFGGELNAEVGNFGKRSVSAVLNLPLTNKLSFRVAGDYSDSNGYGYDDLNKVRLGRLETEYLRATLLANLTDNLSVTLRGEYQRGKSNSDVGKALFLLPGSISETQVALQLANLPRGTVVTPEQRAAAQAAWQSLVGGDPYHTQYDSPLDQDLEVAAGSATINYEIGDVKLTSISAYRSFRERRELDTDATPFSIIQPVISQDLDQYTQELQLSANLHDKLSVVLGGYYFYSTGFDDTVVTTLDRVNAANPTTQYATYTTHSEAVYGQLIYSLSDKVRFTGGLRYTHDRKTNDAGATNPVQGCISFPGELVDGPTGPCLIKKKVTSDNISYLAVLDWQVNNGLFVYLKTSRGYKSGGLQLRAGVNATSLLPYEPEVVTDYEVGLKGDFFDNRLRTNIAAFRSNYSNIQRNVIRNNGGIVATIVTNAASATIDGVELEVGAVPWRGARLRGTAAWIDPRYNTYLNNGIDVSAQRFQYISNWTYSISASQEVPTRFGSVRAQLDWNWRSKMDFVPEAFQLLPDSLREQKGYGLLNAQLTATTLDSGLTFSAYVQNVFDKRYRATVNQQVTSGLGIVSVIPGQPRIFGVRASYEF